MKDDIFFYMLKGREVVQTGSVHEWGRFMELDRRVVAKTTVGDAEVSTVFLGVDHRFGEGPPILFETMIFGGERDQEQWRYCTYDEAEEGHKKIVDELKGAAVDALTNPPRRKIDLEGGET